MSECHFWWRSGDVQWCDMNGSECHCGGWDESCDLKTTHNPGRRSESLTGMRAKAANRQKSRRKRLKGAA